MVSSFHLESDKEERDSDYAIMFGSRLADKLGNSLPNGSIARTKYDKLQKQTLNSSNYSQNHETVLSHSPFETVNQPIVYVSYYPQNAADSPLKYSTEGSDNLIQHVTAKMYVQDRFQQTAYNKTGKNDVEAKDYTPIDINTKDYRVISSIGFLKNGSDRNEVQGNFPVNTYQKDNSKSLNPIRNKEESPLQIINGDYQVIPSVELFQSENIPDSVGNSLHLPTHKENNNDQNIRGYNKKEESPLHVRKQDYQVIPSAELFPTKNNEDYVLDSFHLTTLQDGQDFHDTREKEETPLHVGDEDYQVIPSVEFLKNEKNPDFETETFHLTAQNVHGTQDKGKSALIFSNQDTEIIPSVDITQNGNEHKQNQLDDSLGQEDSSLQEALNFQPNVADDQSSSSGESNSLPTLNKNNYIPLPYLSPPPILSGDEHLHIPSSTTRYEYIPPLSASTEGYDYKPPSALPAEGYVYKPPPPRFPGYDYKPPSQPTGGYTYLPPPVSDPEYATYHIGTKLWYLPLIFSAYFSMYVIWLILVALIRHRVSFIQNLFNAANGVFSAQRTNSEDSLNQILNKITTAIRSASEKYS